MLAVSMQQVSTRRPVGIAFATVALHFSWAQTFVEVIRISMPKDLGFERINWGSVGAFFRTYITKSGLKK